MALERLQVNVEGDLLRQVDAYADSLHITRTAAVSFSCLVHYRLTSWLLICPS